MIIENLIDKVMVQNKFNYKKHLYKDYSGVFFSIVKEEIPNKIYILDIETPSGSGIDAAKKIRIDDYTSKIIFLTAYEKKYALTILKSELLIVSFVSKLDTGFEKKLESAIKRAISLLGEKEYFVFKTHYMKYIIELSNIFYIVSDKGTSYSIIYTSNGAVKIDLSLSQILPLLNSKFVYTHRSCIVNKDNIIKVDKKKNVIYFKNNTQIDLISKNYKDNI